MAFAVLEPATLTEALSHLAHEGDAGAALAGGTDLLLRIRRGGRKYRSVINLKFVPGLTGLAWDDQRGLTMGALTTFRAIEHDPHARRHYHALVEAARVIAGVQLRNLATVGGNIGNASPSADSVPPLVALGATIEIASTSGMRVVPVESCITGPGKTVLAPGEIFTTIHIPAPSTRSGNAFSRFSPRAAMDIGIASVAASVTLDTDGRCADCRIALGAVSPIPLRATASEAALRGERLTPALADLAGELAAAATRPISDIRGSASYRRAIVRTLTTRVIQQAAARAATAGAR
ncbi:MAG TPA: FAD binding domain-containing protein [Vicinamibacterales bacterium]|nr:FAD binding domain-containing protein [Vicinamibacterales bacterium]